MSNEVVKHQMRSSYNLIKFFQDQIRFEMQFIAFFMHTTVYKNLDDVSWNTKET